MMDMTVGELAQAVQGAVAHADGAQGVVTSVCTDSRQARQGSLFVAIRGERVDGHDFVAQAAKAGATAALVNHEVDVDVPQIVVDDTVAALGRVAKANVALRRSFAVASDEGDDSASCDEGNKPAIAGPFDPAAPHPFTVVGITGSVGKTTTKDLLAAMLRTQGSTVAPVGSFNNEIGLPLTATQVGEDTRYLVAEMGASAMGEIRYLTSIVPPDVSVVLKVGVAHLGGFGSVENIRRAKAEIVQVLETQGAASPHRMAVSTVEPPLVPAAFTLIDDSFNANPDSMKAGLDGLAAWHAGDCRDRPFRVAVLGSMLELGDDDEAKHRDIGAYCAHLGVDALVAVGSDADANLDRLASCLAQGAQQADGHSLMDVAFVHSADQAAEEVARLAKTHQGSVVLLKGSHASGLSALAAKWSPVTAHRA